MATTAPPAATAGMDPEGMGAHMGAGLQVVEAVPFDQNVLLSAITDSRLVLSGDIKDFKKEVVLHIDKVVKKEGNARKKAIKDVKASLKAQNKDFHQRLEQHNEDLQKRLALLEQGAACSKRPRSAPYEAPRDRKSVV